MEQNARGSLERKQQIKLSHRLLYKEDQCDSLQRENVEFSPNMCRALLIYHAYMGKCVA